MKYGALILAAGLASCGSPAGGRRRHPSSGRAKSPISACCTGRTAPAATASMDKEH